MESIPALTRAAGCRPVRGALENLVRADQTVSLELEIGEHIVGEFTRPGLGLASACLDLDERCPSVRRACAGRHMSTLNDSFSVPRNAAKKVRGHHLPVGIDLIPAIL